MVWAWETGFESGVISDGGQTFIYGRGYIKKFESGVISDGGQTFYI